MPETEYKEDLGGFSVYFYKDIYREEKLKGVGLNEWQIKAVKHIRENGKITNMEYQDLCQIKKRQTSIDSKELENMKILERIGITGKGTYYILRGIEGG